MGVVGMGSPATLLLAMVTHACAYRTTRNKPAVLLADAALFLFTLSND